MDLTMQDVSLLRTNQGGHGRHSMSTQCLGYAMERRGHGEAAIRGAEGAQSFEKGTAKSMHFLASCTFSHAKSQPPFFFGQIAVPGPSVQIA